MRGGIAVTAGEEARCVHFAVIDILGNVAVVAAVHLGRAGRDAHAERVGQRAGGIAFDAVLLALELVTALHHEFWGAGRVCGGDRDHARGRVLAEEQRLRALEHFHAGKVEEAFLNHAALTVVGAVDDDGDRLFDADRGRRRADAAKGQLRARTVGSTAHVELGRDRSDLLDTGHVAVDDVRGGNGGNRDRHVLNRFLTLAGCDDDFLNAALLTCAGLVRSCLLRQGRGCRHRHSQNSACQQHRFRDAHFRYLP